MTEEGNGILTRESTAQNDGINTPTPTPLPRGELKTVRVRVRIKIKDNHPVASDTPPQEGN